MNFPVTLYQILHLIDEFVICRHGFQFSIHAVVYFWEQRARGVSSTRRQDGERLAQIITETQPSAEQFCWHCHGGKRSLRRDLGIYIGTNSYEHQSIWTVNGWRSGFSCNSWWGASIWVRPFCCSCKAKKVILLLLYTCY